MTLPRGTDTGPEIVGGNGETTYDAFTGLDEPAEPMDYSPIRTCCDEKDRLVRLFNRLEAAVSHHKKAHDSGRYFADDPDEALWKAREKILNDYAEGKG